MLQTDVANSLELHTNRSFKGENGNCGKEATQRRKGAMERSYYERTGTIERGTLGKRKRLWKGGYEKGAIKQRT